MKKILFASAILAMSVASPAMAQTVGGVVGGIGGNVGASSGFDMSATHNDKLSIGIDNTLTGSSGSGFSADIGLKDGASATIGSFGIAGTTTVAGPNGVVSASGNLASFDAETFGNSKLDASVMNFGQSEFTNSFTLDYSAANKTSFDAWNNSSFDVSFGAIGGFAGFSW